MFSDVSSLLMVQANKLMDQYEVSVDEIFSVKALMCSFKDSVASESKYKIIGASVNEILR